MGRICRPSGLSVRDLGRYCGRGDLPKVAWIRVPSSLLGYV